jgi:hypothetical protein
MTLLLVWDKDNHTGSLLVIFHAYMCSTSN